MSETIFKKSVSTESEEISYNSLKTRKADMIYVFIKRFTDIVFSLIGIILLLPVVLLISIFYFFGKNKGPIIFAQSRIGKNGKVFKLYKFRSMIVNAEEILKSNEVLYKNYLLNNYKLDPEEDPRVTKFGMFLRKTSLDEIPQLLNVIMGDMSLVGPRPVVKEELIEYKERLSEFLLVKPGVTGYWQICGRSEVGYPERAKLEFYYIDNRGVKMDFYILIRTAFLVLSRKGAY